jgi:hypothetical protein
MNLEHQSHQDFTSTNPVPLSAIYQQNWENARFVKSQRMWFMNAFGVINAGVLSLLQGTRGDVVPQIGLVVFMCLFSSIGLVTSLRLKAELEQCFNKIRALVVEGRVEKYVALEEAEGDLARYPKFRWVFSIFYLMITFGYLAFLVFLLISRGVSK